VTAGAGLEVTGLVRRRGGRRVVDGLALSIRPSEVVGLLGPNGAGKSTSFRMILGLEEMDEGEVSLDGQSLDGLSLWRRIRAGLGYLPQESSVFRRLSVRGNIEVALEAIGSAGGPCVDDILRDAGLLKLSAFRADTLSGGEKRRLEIARCLATQPRIVLFDEPFAGVDPLAISSLKTRLRSLAERGIGVLITDHAVHDTLAICDRAVIIDKGCVVAAGSPEEVSEVPEVRSRYLGLDFRLRSSAP
jgi:lipopolysaccharide export system ATP-binding protein